MRRDTVLFDMGNVLIGWEVRPPFRPHFEDETQLEDFLVGPFREIYDAVHDGDGSMAECLDSVRSRLPQAAHLIDVYENWGAFITGVMDESVAIVRELHAGGVRLYGLTNWPAQTWPPHRVAGVAPESYEFLGLFADFFVSGEHKLRKPDPEMYRAALQRFGVAAEQSVFVDDLLPNVEVANDLGFHGLHFRDAETLRRDLQGLALL